MHHKIWLTLFSTLLIGSVGGILSNQPVQARRRYRPRIHRQSCFRHPRIMKIPKSVYPEDLLSYSHNGQTGYTRNYFRIHRYQTKMSKGYVNSVVKNEYQAINQAREKNHEKPLIKNGNLIKLARWRAKQAERHFTHYNRKGQPLARIDAAKMHLGSYRYNQHNIGENMFFAGKWSRVQLDNGHITGTADYFFKDPWALAGDNVFDSLNNDAASQWAHGDNIMTPLYHYIGIGTYYKRSNRGLYVLVEFSSKKPVVHKK